MATLSLGIIINGITGRMGTNQHLARSIVAIRQAGGVPLANGDVVMPDPILVGRNEQKMHALADRYGTSRWSTDLDACLANPADVIYFDAQITQRRAKACARRLQPENMSTAKNCPQQRSMMRLIWCAARKLLASGTASCRINSFSPVCANSNAWLKAVSLAESSRCAVSSATGFSRRTGNPGSVLPGTIAGRRAAAPLSICSATGAMCSITCSLWCVQ